MLCTEGKTNAKLTLTIKIKIKKNRILPLDISPESREMANRTINRLTILAMGL